MRRVLALACAAIVSSAVLGAVPAPRASAAPDDGEAVLQADADGPLRIRREGGVATFVGTPAGTDIDNPDVGRGTGVSAAARAHLVRYGDAIGADRAATRLVERDRSAAAAGSAVVRYEQQVGGLPVLGGDVVVTLDKDHDLASLDARLSDASPAGSATVSEDAARTTALGTVGRSRVKGATAEDLGRWVLDPETIPVDGLTQARTAWRFEVRAGDDVRRMVLVDDRSGVVLLDVDLIQHADRYVCDRKNVSVLDPAPCTANPTRYEGGPVSSGDTEAAFINAGRVSDFYAQFGVGAMTDLTDLIGISTAAGKKLASSVRVCIKGIPCPYDNAYWNGRAMFYGANYPKADDIVGHEMTHGVIERIPGLLYLDQSGAINESLADIIGEIIDHRNTGDNDAAFLLGENVGAFRSAANPPLYGQPDRMTSSRWYAGQEDAGGVHTNSGVGNKAFHLISQGGTFNGQTIAGIDAGDSGLAKSARLWTQVIATIPAYAEYDDLASVLEQSCATLQGTVLTEADCTAVHQAVLATEMTARPASEPVRDAARSCPGGAARQVLFDSESAADPAGAFTAPSGGWHRLPDPAVPEHAYSGDTAWYGEEGATGVDNTVARRPLGATAWIDLPAGQRAYLAFRHWHVFESWPEIGEYYDGGSVQLLRNGPASAVLDHQPWAFGPGRTLAYNLLPNRKVFAGSSKGWVGSRVDLSEFAGQQVKPQFTMHYDAHWGGPGWYLDDIEVYTCEVAPGTPVLTGTPALSSGTPRVGRPVGLTGITWADPATVPAFQWRRNGVPISGATKASYTPTPADRGKALSVRLTGTLGGLTSMPYVRATSLVQAGAITAPRTVTASGSPYVGRRLTALRGTWSPSGITFTYQWLRDGRAIAGATRSTFVIRRTDKGHRISVRITGRKAGYTTVVRTSARRLVTR